MCRKTEGRPAQRQRPASAVTDLLRDRPRVGARCRRSPPVSASGGSEVGACISRGILVHHHGIADRRRRQDVAAACGDGNGDHPDAEQPAARNILLLFVVVFFDAVFMVPASVIRLTSLTRRQCKARCRPATDSRGRHRACAGLFHLRHLAISFALSCDCAVRPSVLRPRITPGVLYRADQF